MKLIKILLLLAAFSSYAQIRFEPGYFIDNSGTRQEVLIRNVEWKNNPTVFDYKTSENTENQQRTIGNTSEFSVGGNTYKRFEVKIDRSSSITDQMSDSPVIDWNTETLFLKRLVDGRLTLYQYEDSNLVKYFYSEGTHNTATQLIFREYKQDGIINVNNNFRQQLYSLMRDKYTDSNKFKSLKYKKAELTKLFEEYNDVDANASKSDTGSKAAFHLNIAAGAVFSNIEAEGTGYPYYQADFSATSYRVGVQAEYVFPFNRNKWSLLLDPNYQRYSINETSGSNTWAFEYQRLEIPVVVRHYFFLNDKSKIFVNGIFAPSISLGDSYIQRNATPPMKLLNNSSWAFGAGFSYDKFSLEARYVFKHGLTNEGDWFTDFNSLHLVLGYRLF